jgi:hypothetical protein
VYKRRDPAVRAIQYDGTSVSASQVLAFVNQSRDYAASRAVIPSGETILLFCRTDRVTTTTAITDGDWVVNEFDGTMRVFPHASFAQEYQACSDPGYMGAVFDDPLRMEDDEVGEMVHWSLSKDCVLDFIDDRGVESEFVPAVGPRGVHVTISTGPDFPGSGVQHRAVTADQLEAYARRLRGLAYECRLRDAAASTETETSP